MLSWELQWGLGCVIMFGGDMIGRQLLCACVLLEAVALVGRKVVGTMYTGFRAGSTRKVLLVVNNRQQSLTSTVPRKRCLTTLHYASEM